MRPATLWDDCHTLLDVVPQQHLQKQLIHSTLPMWGYLAAVGNLRGASLVLLGDCCHRGVLQDPVWVAGFI